MSEHNPILDRYVNSVIGVLQRELNFTSDAQKVAVLEAALRSDGFSQFQIAQGFTSYTLSSERGDGEPGLWVKRNTAGSVADEVKVQAVNDELLALNRRMVKQTLKGIPLPSK